MWHEYEIEWEQEEVSTAQIKLYAHTAHVDEENGCLSGGFCTSAARPNGIHARYDDLIIRNQPFLSAIATDRSLTLPHLLKCEHEHKQTTLTPSRSRTLFRFWHVRRLKPRCTVNAI